MNAKANKTKFRCSSVFKLYHAYLIVIFWIISTQ